MRTLATQVRLRRLIRTFAEVVDRLLAEPSERLLATSGVSRLQGLAEGGELIRDVLAVAATGHVHHERLRFGITRFVTACFERSTVARLLIVESVGLSSSIDDVRHELQGRFASAVAEEVRHAMPHDAFYADKDPAVFGRAVVGAVNDAVSYFLTHPGADADSLAASLCLIFAP